MEYIIYNKKIFKKKLEQLSAYYENKTITVWMSGTVRHSFKIRVKKALVDDEYFIISDGKNTSLQIEMYEIDAMRIFKGSLTLYINEEKILFSV